MAFTFNPAIYRPSGSIHYLSQPIVTCKVKNKWMQDNDTIPWRKGGKTYGAAQGPISIEVSGSVGHVNSTQKITESDMFTVYSDLITYIDTAMAAGNALEFFLYHDSSGGGTYRKYKSVYPDEVELEVGDQEYHAYGWTFTAHTDDTVIYTTAPGS